MNTTALTRFAASALAALTFAAALPAHAGDTTAAAQLQRWQQVAGGAGNAARGQTFYNAKGGNGSDWSCASCHATSPTQAGKHASTGKVVEPLAPSANPARFTDTAKVDKWFKRNCKDVYSRECTAIEKADVMAFLLTVK